MGVVVHKQQVNDGKGAPPQEPWRRRWTREDYYRMAEVGLLPPEERVELIDGEVVQMSPQRSQHATAVSLAYEALRTAFARLFHVRQQLPFRVGETSEPNPDLAVVEGTAHDYTEAHPSSAVLIVEVSDTTLPHDRSGKASLYASAQVPHYWIADLVNRRVEVRRDPVPVEAEVFGYGYRTITLHFPGERISCQTVPGVAIEVEDLLPRTSEEPTP